MKAAVAAVLLTTAAAPLAAQTLTERLQKGIYTEETLGDTNTAIAIYQQILIAAPAQHQVARHARERLNVAMARNQTRAGAGQVATIGPRTYSIGGRREPLARFANGRYHHTWSGIEFSVPPGWEVGQTGPSSDHGEQVALRHVDSGVTLSVWMIKESTPPEALRARLDGAPAEKVRQRKNGYSIPGFIAETYDIPDHTVQLTWIGGQPAVLAIGEYIGVTQPPWRVGPVGATVLSAAGEKRALPAQVFQTGPEPLREYMTWIYTENSRAFFFGRVTAGDLENFRPLFDTIIQSAVVP